MAANKTQILVSARDQASAVFGRVAKNSTRAQKNIFGVNNALKGTDKTIGSLSTSVKGLVGGVAAGLGVSAIFGSVKDAIAIKVEYDKINNVLKAVTGSTKAAQSEFKFLREESERLGLQLRPLAQTYTRLAASGKLLGLSTDDTREIFTSFSEALTGFGATREQSIRVFTAIEQILSKGKASAEELRGQLGEALPGSFQLAAKAAGVTVQELDKMLKQGKLLSKDFILPFAQAVKNEFGGAAVEGAKLLNAEFSRTINTLDQVKLAFVEGGEAGSSLSDSLARVLKSFREFLSDGDRIDRIAQFGVQFGAAMEIAANAIQKIANIISAIPTEVLFGLGAFAIGKLGGRGSGAAVASRANTQGGRSFTNFEGITSGLGGVASFGALSLQEKILKKGRESRETFSFDRQGNQTGVSETLYNKKQPKPGVFKKATKGLTVFAGSLKGLISPLTAASIGIGLLAKKTLEIKQEFDEASRARIKGEGSELLTRAFQDIAKRRKSGQSLSTDDTDEILFGAQGSLLEDDSKKFVAVTDNMRAAINKMIEGFKKAPEAVEKIDLKVFMATQSIEKNIDAIQTEIGVRQKYGKEQADIRLRFIALRNAALKMNISYEDSIKLARRQVKEEEKLKGIKKAQREAQTAKDAVDSSKKTTAAIREEIAVRQKYAGQSKKFIETQVRIAEIIRGLIAKGVSPEEAKKQAGEQVSAENKLKGLQPKQKPIADVIGQASLFNSLETATRIQSRVQNSTEKTKAKKAEKAKKEEQKQQKEQTDATKKAEKTLSNVYDLLNRMGKQLRIV